MEPEYNLVYGEIVTVVNQFSVIQAVLALELKPLVVFLSLVKHTICLLTVVLETFVTLL